MGGIQCNMQTRPTAMKKLRIRNSLVCRAYTHPTSTEPNEQAEFYGTPYGVWYENNMLLLLLGRKLFGCVSFRVHVRVRVPTYDCWVAVGYPELSSLGCG